MKTVQLFPLALLFSLIIGCANETKEEKKELTIGYVDGWAEGVAMTYIANEVLSQQGYDVDMKKAAVDLVFASLANGDTDVFMDTWLPITHKEKVAKFEGKIEQLGTNYSNAKIGLVVPDYVNIESIEELNAHKDKFDNKIIGIEKGAGLTAKTEKAIEEYNLDLEQLNSSSIAMVTELQKAIGENRWVVVAGWAPHWKFGRFDLKFLQDPKKVYGDKERIDTYARVGLKTEDAFVSQFFSHFSLNEQQMANLLAKMEEGEDKKDIAKQWIQDNQSLVDSWMK